MTDTTHEAGLNPEPTERPWSQYSPHELLDKAQTCATAEMCHALLMAAQVQATVSLEWTLENRVAPTIGQRP